MKIELSHTATRFLALSAIALTLSALPSRADWTTVRPDGSVVTVPSNSKPGANHSLQVTNGANDYANDSADNVPNVATYDGPGRLSSPRVQANRERNRQRNNARRGNGPGRIRSIGGVGYGAGLGYGAVPAYPGYGYNVPSYPYGVPYGYGGYGYNGGVVAPGATIILPQGPTTTAIAPAPFPWVIPPTITTVPVGGTIITPQGQTFTYGNPYPYGLPQGYSYPNGSITQSYGGISISRGGISASIGGSTTSTQTQTTYGTGLYR